MKESKLVLNMVKWLNQQPYTWARKIVAHPAQRTGVPDILGCYDGRFFGLEVKMPGRENTLTPRQAYALESIAAAGGIAAIVTSIAEIRAAVYETEDQ